MSIKKLMILAIVLLVAFTVVSFAQNETAVKGNLAGEIQDANGAVVPGATVTLTGATGSATTQTGNDGKFIFSTLTPGYYGVKVEKSSFKTAELKSVEVLTGVTAQITVKLETGATGTVVEVTATATTVDTESTAVGTNLSDSFYQAVPIQRNVASLFYTAPGVVDGGRLAGKSNPSISGGSALENQYIADGVNITNSAYGGLGVFTQNQGAVGSGINLSFIKEVDVKEGGFEPQYGQATGGVIQIITKSGGSTYHGVVAVYLQPSGTRADAMQRDDFRQIKIGEIIDKSAYEGSAEIGGYVPHFKDHLFFFGSFDPTRLTSFQQPPAASGLFTSGFTLLPVHFDTFNYAGKVTYKINDKHSIEGTVFGDPSRTNTTSTTTSLNSNNTNGFSNWRYGTRNVTGRYNGTLSPTWLVNASFNYNTNYFFEHPLSDVFQILDAQQTVLDGYGRLEQHDAHQYAFSIDTSKVVHAFGTHTFSVGYHNERPTYINIQNRSGGTYTIPGTNYLGGAYLPASPLPLAQQQSDAQFIILPVPGGAAGCPICPVFNTFDNNGNPETVPVFAEQFRGQFGGSGAVHTHAIYHDAYVNDNWSINKYVNLSLGLRWEQQHVSGTLASYTFVDNWSPRVGISVDPFGDRKTKLYANFGRYSYDLPLDAAIRSLSGENDLLNEDFAPVLGGSAGIMVVPDQAHAINSTGTIGAPALSIAGLGENFIHGTKMTYENEFVIGAEREWKGVVFSARYIDRRLQRIIEDASGTSPEGAFVHLQNFEIVNPSPTLDAWVNEQEQVVPAGTALAAFPAGCNASNTLGYIAATGVAGPSKDGNGNVFSPNSVCFLSPGPGLVGGEVGPDGKPDGFAQPQRNYTAFELEANKSFSHNYLMRINWRRAKLFGNYEGAFRNDNGQIDPGISSLFDFTTGQYNLLGGQFTPGYLPTDRRNVVNGFFSYTFPQGMVKGLTLGTSIRAQSGIPITLLGNHPVYTNAGEVPLGGRGSLGRTPTSGNVDLKIDYPWRFGERYTMRFSADLFNIANARKPLTIDGTNALNFEPAGTNPDFQQPLQFQDPFTARFTIKFEF